MKKNITRFTQVLMSCMVILSLSSFGVLTAIVGPVSNAGRSFESVSHVERAGFSVVTAPITTPTLEFQAAGMGLLSMETLMTLTPAKYKQMTGKRMGFFKSLELRLVQKQLKKQQAPEGGGGLPKWAYIVMSLLALGWLAIGIQSNFRGNDWWIALLLYFLFYLPGLIYSLIVMKKYY